MVAGAGSLSQSSMYQKTAAVYETGEVFSGSKFRGTSAVFCALKTAVVAG